MKTLPFIRDSRHAAPSGTSDLELYMLLLVIGLAIVVPTLVRHLAWGVQPTLGALLVVVAGRPLLLALVLRLRGRSGSGHGHPRI